MFVSLMYRTYRKSVQTRLDDKIDLISLFESKAKLRNFEQVSTRNVMPGTEDCAAPNAQQAFEHIRKEFSVRNDQNNMPFCGKTLRIARESCLKAVGECTNNAVERQYNNTSKSRKMSDMFVHSSDAKMGSTKPCTSSSNTEKAFAIRDNVNGKILNSQTVQHTVSEKRFSKELTEVFSTVKRNVEKQNNVREYNVILLNCLKNQIMPAQQTLLERSVKKARTLYSKNKQEKVLNLLPEAEWRSMKSLPNDHTLDLETGRLCNISRSFQRTRSTCQRTEIADVQINEITSNGKIVFSPSNDNTRSVVPASENHRYLLCVLHGTGKGTTQAIETLSSVFRISKERFSTTQLHERNVVFSQLISIEFKQPADKFVTLVKRINNCQTHLIKLCPFSWERNKLQVGNLKGNYYSLLLRHFKDRTSTLERHVSTLGSNGFINYFSQRRFGFCSFGNHLIGLCVARKDFETALTMIVQNEAERIGTTDVQSIFSRHPWVQQFTSVLCDKKEGENILESIYHSLPISERMLHFTALRSYLWNLLASCRYSAALVDSTSACVGDLIGGDSPGMSAVSWENVDSETPTLNNHDNVHNLLAQRFPRDTVNSKLITEVDSQDLATTTSIEQVLVAIPLNPSSPCCSLEKEMCKSLHIRKGNLLRNFGLTEILRSKDCNAEYRYIIARPRKYSIFVIPESEKLESSIRLRSDQNIACTSEPLLSRTELAGSLLSLRLFSSCCRAARAKTTLYGSYARRGTRAAAIGFMLPYPSMCSAALREVVRFKRQVQRWPVCGAEGDHEEPAQRPVRLREVANLDQQEDVRHEGDYLKIGFHRKSLRNATNQKLTGTHRDKLKKKFEWDVDKLS